MFTLKLFLSLIFFIALATYFIYKWGRAKERIDMQRISNDEVQKVIDEQREVDDVIKDMSDSELDDNI